MIIALASKGVLLCCCTKGVLSNGEGGFVPNPKVRIGRNDKCSVHTEPTIVEEDEFAFETPLLPPSAPS